jgi:hypothetical protein
MKRVAGGRYVVQIDRNPFITPGRQWNTNGGVYTFTAQIFRHSAYIPYLPYSRACFLELNGTEKILGKVRTVSEAFFYKKIIKFSLQKCHFGRRTCMTWGRCYPIHFYKIHILKLT